MSRKKNVYTKVGVEWTNKLKAGIYVFIMNTKYITEWIKNTKINTRMEMSGKFNDFQTHSSKIH